MLNMDTKRKILPICFSKVIPGERKIFSRPRKNRKNLFVHVSVSADGTGGRRTFEWEYSWNENVKSFQTFIFAKKTPCFRKKNSRKQIKILKNQHIFSCCRAHLFFVLHIVFSKTNIYLNLSFAFCKSFMEKSTFVDFRNFLKYNLRIFL